MSTKTNPKSEQALLGVGLGLLAAFTGGAHGEGSVVVIAFRFVVFTLVILATQCAYHWSAHPTRLPATT